MSDYHRNLILYAVARGARTTGEIVRECGGVFPPDVESLLGDLCANGQLRHKNGEYYLEQQVQPPRHKPHTLDLLEPHPLDYDWRFTPQTAARLTRLVMDHSRLNRRVLLLGAPTILGELAQRDSPPETIMLDWSAALVDFMHDRLRGDALSIYRHDLLGGTLWDAPEQADVTLCDPPWYPEYYTAFLAQAAHTTRLGGTVMVSLLSPNIRPDAIHERNHVFAQAHRMGLALEGMESGTLAYVPSTFEVNSLHSVGLDLPDDWHYGDLATFRKFTRDAPLAEIMREVTRPGEHWHEILVGKRKVKLRGDLHDDSPPALLSIEPNDTLPTVGRGYHGREQVDLWLWDNRVFRVEGKAAIWAALHHAAGKTPPHDSAYVEQALDLLHPHLNGIRDDV